MTVRRKGGMKVTERLSSCHPASFQGSSERVECVNEQAVRLAKENVIRSGWSRVLGGRSWDWEISGGWPSEARMEG